MERYTNFRTDLQHGHLHTNQRNGDNTVCFLAYLETQLTEKNMCRARWESVFTSATACVTFPVITKWIPLKLSMLLPNGYPDTVNSITKWIPLILSMLLPNGYPDTLNIITKWIPLTLSMLLSMDTPDTVIVITKWIPLKLLMLLPSGYHDTVNVITKWIP